jgi:magnesium chelatase subunit I
MTNITKIKTLGELISSGYKSKTIKEELRANLIQKIKKKEKLFDSIKAYDETVIPDLQRAILSRHNILLLGLRGQAKTRIARLMTELLDEYIPYIKGTDLNEDPLNPISMTAKRIIEVHGNNTEIEWLHRDERYTEKLATPDVSVADLIGDVDPVKAANLKLPYSDERVIHFGLIPRSNRSIFVINELPDLQARIQVSLFNILQEGDIQIRGFKIRLPLDIEFVFTANPEDYTNRGAIVTPLKDRIESQILTHYPKDIETSREITLQEAEISKEQEANISSHKLIEDLLEQIAFEARSNEFIDPKSGVSARLTISAYENLFSAAERRMLMNDESKTTIRLTDFWGVIPSITGKIELVYEGEQEGSLIVAQNLIGKAIRKQFTNYFPDPEKLKKKKEPNPFAEIIEWFAAGNEVDILNDMPNKEYTKVISSVPGLDEAVKKYFPKIKGEEKTLMQEFILHGLAEFSMLSKNNLVSGLRFRDLFTSVFNQGSSSSN